MITTVGKPIIDVSGRIETLLQEKLWICREIKRQCLLERRWIRKGNINRFIHGLEEKGTVIEKLEVLNDELEKLIGGREHRSGTISGGRYTHSEAEKKINRIISEIDYINKRNEQILRKTRDKVIEEVKLIDRSKVATRIYRKSFS